MSTRDRYIKIIESLVDGDEALASDLLHEAFVDQAREIWNDLVEADEIIEDELADEELEEAFGGEEADDFIDDIESDEDEIEAEEMYGEAEEEDMDDLEASDELADVDGDEMDFNQDGEMDSHEEEHSEIEDSLMNVEDALEDLKAEFARLMGDMGDDEGEEAEMGDEMDSDMDMEMDMDDEEEVEEELAFEAAELKKVGKEKAVHPVAMPDETHGAAGPVGPGREDPFAHGKANGAKKEPVDMSKKGSEGSAKGLSDTNAKDMGVTHPGDGASLKPENRGHGAEKKGKAQ